MNTTVYWIRTDNGGGRKRFMEDNSHWVPSARPMAPEDIDPALFDRPAKAVEFQTREAAITYLGTLVRGGVPRVNEMLASGLYEIVPMQAGTRLTDVEPLPAKKTKKPTSPAAGEVLVMTIAELHIGRERQFALEIEFDQKWNDYQKRVRR